MKNKMKRALWLIVELVLLASRLCLHGYVFREGFSHGSLFAVLTMVFAISIWGTFEVLVP